MVHDGVLCQMHFESKLSTEFFSCPLLTIKNTLMLVFKNLSNISVYFESSTEVQKNLAENSNPKTCMFHFRWSNQNNDKSSRVKCETIYGCSSSL